LAQRVLNVGLLVGYYQVADHAESIGLKQLGNRRAGYIHPLSPEAGIAHGNDGGSHHRFGCCPRFPLKTIVRVLCESLIAAGSETMRE
jgi:hypothetical protein